MIVETKHLRQGRRDDCPRLYVLELYIYRGIYSSKDEVDYSLDCGSDDKLGGICTCTPSHEVESVSRRCVGDDTPGGVIEPSAGS